MQTGQGRSIHSGIFTVRKNPLSSGQGHAFHDGSLGQTFRDGSLGQGAHVVHDGSLGVLGQAGSFRDGSLGGRRTMRGFGDDSAVAVSVSPTTVLVGGLVAAGLGVFAIYRLTKK